MTQTCCEKCENNTLGGICYCPCHQPKSQCACQGVGGFTLHSESHCCRGNNHQCDAKSSYEKTYNCWPGQDKHQVGCPHREWEKEKMGQIEICCIKCFDNTALGKEDNCSCHQLKSQEKCSCLGAICKEHGRNYDIFEQNPTWQEQVPSLVVYSIDLESGNAKIDTVLTIVKIEEFTTSVEQAAIERERKNLARHSKRFKVSKEEYMNWLANNIKK